MESTPGIDPANVGKRPLKCILFMGCLLFLCKSPQAQAADFVELASCDATPYSAASTLVGDFIGSGEQQFLVLSNSSKMISALELKNSACVEHKTNISLTGVTSIFAARCNEDDCDDLFLQDTSGAFSCQISDCRGNFSKKEIDHSYPAHSTLIGLGKIPNKLSASSSMQALFFFLPESQRIQMVSFEGLPIESLDVHLRSDEQSSNQFILGDFDGDSFTDVLRGSTFYRPQPMIANRWTAYLSKHQYQTDTKMLWAEFPESFHYQRIFPISTNSEPRKDLLATIDSSNTFFLARSNERYALELPLTRPKRKEPALNTFALHSKGWGGELVVEQSKSSFSFLRFESAEKVATTLTNLNNFSHPQACSGYHPGSIHRWGRSIRFCPAHYSIAATNDWTRSGIKKQLGSFASVCCPLPAEDIFLEPLKYQEDSCDPGSIITGMENRSGKAVYECQKLNENRYQLGPPQEGRYWGSGGSNVLIGDGLIFEQIPTSISTAISRMEYRMFTADGCVPQPYGALLTAHRPERGCSGFIYQELQYKGAPNDPPQNTPVIMYPTCPELAETFSPFASCLHEPPNRKTLERN